jgi:hypothetical protein
MEMGREMWRGKEMEIRREMEMVDVDEEQGGYGREIEKRREKEMELNKPRS